MNYLLKCLNCGEKYWRRGEDDPETNGYEITDSRGDSCPKCHGDDWEVIAEEFLTNLFDIDNTIGV